MWGIASICAKGTAHKTKNYLIPKQEETEKQEVLVLLGRARSSTPHTRGGRAWNVVVYFVIVHAVESSQVKFFMSLLIIHICKFFMSLLIIQIPFKQGFPSCSQLQ